MNTTETPRQPLSELWQQTTHLMTLWWQALRRLAGQFQANRTQDNASSSTDESQTTPERGQTLQHHFYRSSNQRMFLGVCGGLAEYFGVSVTVVRFIFVVAFFTGIVHAVIPYIVLAFLMKEQPWSVRR